ncbi:ryanodine receptor 3, brain [Culex quinquefasciatus]|uniref:Ryanodine receptor 3, brain n=1 Tax=Culex quinquefasciatus TaxID=7176 RepID=B0XF20_CULQU|nr:ryanodine receptor 3, brain [Culex quinquefasciatus]|eukprot:XP_001868242.1 ryanodine receptor 3, brain [Culex quinquefasciatus]
MRKGTSLTIRRAATSGRAQVMVQDAAEVVPIGGGITEGHTTTIRRNKSEEVGVKDTNPADQMALPELENEPMNKLHESPALNPSSSVEETDESSPEDGGPGEFPGAGAGEFPMTLADLLCGEAAKRAAQERSEAQKAQDATLASIEAESKKTSAEPKEPAAVTQIDFSKYSKKAVSYLARNFYNLKYVAVVLAFGINFMLLFYKVTTFGDDEEAAEGSGEDLMGLASGMGSGLVNAILEGGSGEGGSGEGEEDGEDPLEKVEVDEDFFYMEHVMRIAACLHSLVSLCMLIAYSHLKVPLAIFKREKEIARRLEFDGLFIAEQPEDDDIKSHWDKLVISAKTFPVNYWDKFVKRKVRAKYSETSEWKETHLPHRKEPRVLASATLLQTSTGDTRSGRPALWYFIFTVMGNFNNFFFAAHLLYVAVDFKTLCTILQSVTHNGKQLARKQDLLEKRSSSSDISFVFSQPQVSIKTFLLLNCKLPPEAEQVQRGLLEVVPMVVVFFESVNTRTTLQNDRHRHDGTKTSCTTK